MSLELHPLCTLFPRLEGIEFEALKADIGQNGQMEPIVLYGGMILDGGNRYRACIEIGIDPLISETDLGDFDPLMYVLSRNLHRRHLTPGQHAAIVAAATDWLETAQQGDNQYTSVTPPDWTVEESGGATLHHHPYDTDNSGPVTLPDLPEEESRATSLRTVGDRAAMAGVSVRTQKMADKVARNDPVLAKRVAHGEISLPKAVRQVEGKDPDAGAGNDSSRLQSGEQSSSDIEDDGPGDSELAYLAEQERADQEAYDALVRVALADEKLAEAIRVINDQQTEIARLRAEVSVLKERQTGLMNEKVALESAAKRWKRVAEQHGYSDKVAK